MIGRIACFEGADTLNGFRGCTGVPNAGEDEGIEEEGGAGVFAAKILAMGIFCLRFGEIDGGGSIVETVFFRTFRVTIAQYDENKPESKSL